MEKTAKKHWYNWILSALMGPREKQKSPLYTRSSPVAALPMIEEWASSEEDAA